MSANDASKLDDLLTDEASNTEDVIMMPRPMNKSRLVEILVNAPKGKWIALSLDESKFIASADTFGEAARLAALEGELAPVIIPNPEEGILAVVP